MQIKIVKKSCEKYNKNWIKFDCDIKLIILFIIIFNLKCCKDYEYFFNFKSENRLYFVPLVFKFLYIVHKVFFRSILKV